MTTPSKKLETNKGRVEYLLKNYAPLRDSDKKLWVAYLVIFHGLREKLLEASDPYDAFCELYLDRSVPSNETIRRLRQRFQETGKYLGKNRRDLAKRKAKKYEKALEKLKLNSVKVKDIRLTISNSSGG